MGNWLFTLERFKGIGMNVVTEKMTNLEWLTQIGLKRLNIPRTRKVLARRAHHGKIVAVLLLQLNALHVRHIVNCWCGVIIGIIHRRLLRFVSTLQESCIPQQRKE